MVVMVKAAVAVRAGEPESVSVTVKLVVPTELGVPLMTPLLDSVSPAGKAPCVSDQV